MRKTIIVLIFLTFILSLFSFYFYRNLVIVRVDSKFKIASINYFEKKNLINKEREIIYLKGVIKGIKENKDIEFFEIGIKGLKSIARGKVLGIMGPLYDFPHKFETSVKILTY